MSNKTDNAETATDEAGRFDELVMPDVCSSTMCEPPKDHCRECSHALYLGEMRVSGLKWSFEFSPMFGVTFVRRDGTSRFHQPKEDSEVWVEWQRWYDDKFKA